MKNASSRKLIRAAQLAVFMCALPALAGEDIYGLGDGHNGSQTLGTGIINLYAKVSAPAAPGDTTITVSSNPGIVIGDLIMVLQTTGIVPEPASGTPGPIDLSNDPVGRWELARVSGVSGATPTVLTMTQPLLYSYAANVTQVIRVPEYVNVTIGGTSSVGARPWNGSIGGVLAFLATGTVTVNATISVTSLGFRGGQPVLDNSTTTTCSGLDQPAPTGAQKGEGIAVTRYGTSQTGRGRVASGGGGGVCVKSGGGGGGNGGAGGDGGNDGNRVVGGQGGTALIAPSLTRLLLGGGGGPGHIRNSPTAAGGTGGGIVFIRANNLTGTGSILADGFYSADISSDDGGGGGGAGGTIHIRLQGTAQCSPSKIHAKGEHGGSIASALTGPGGGGGGGRILLQACGGAPLCPLTASAVAGGPQGIQQSTADPYGAQMGGNGDFTLIPECYYPLTAPVVVTPPNNSSTNNSTPTYSGTLATPFSAGTQVAIYVDGVEIGRVTPDAAGNWSFTQPTALADGTHSVYAIAINSPLQSGPSNTNTFKVDTVPPAAPVVLAPANGSTTSNNKPTYSGTAEAGSTVTVYVDGVVVGTTTANASGAWSFTPATALADGTHSVRATATDAAGNTGPFSNTNSFTVDTTPPVAPVVLVPANGSVTGNNKPTYSGTAEAGTTVTVIVDGVVLGTTTASASGTWSFPQTTALADGTHTVKARATDAVGNTSADSNTNSFTVDTTPPAAPVVVTPANGSTISNNKPAYSGTAEPGSTVTVIVDGTTVGTATADAAGAWNFTQPTALADGTHSVKARATDSAGNTSVDSNTNSFTVDTTPPAAPVVVAPANGSVTSNNKPAYSGTAEPGSTVTVIIDGTTVGTTTANASGAWSFTQPTALADGTHSVKARATDSAGNTSVDSNTNSFTVDTTPPAAPVVVAPANGSVTSNNKPAYSGTAEPGSTVTVIVDGTVVGTTTANASGAWSFTQTTALADGTHTVKARATDALGNTGPDSNTNSFAVDTTAPAAPVVVAPANGSTTSNNKPTYSGTAEPGSTVTVIVDGTVVGTTTANAAGAWSFTQTTALADGTHTVKAHATDAVGNTGPDSNTNSFTVDTTAPAAPVVIAPANGSTTSNNKPAYSGTAEPGSTVTVIVDGTVVGTTTANALGAWSSAQPTALADGTHTVKVRATDALGNTGPDSNTNSFTVDTTPPAAPVVVAPANGSVSSNNKPTYSGTAEPGSTVTVIVDGTVVGTTTADAAGAWSFTSIAALADGTHTVKAHATDAVGNTGPDSNTNSFTVDTTAPAAPVVVAPANGSTTSNNKPAYSGTAEAGSTVTVIVDGATVGTTTANASGAWSFPQTSALADGTHTVKARATDALGNTGPDSNTNSFTVDTTAPAAPVVVAPANGSITSNNKPTYSGTAEPGSTVTIIVDGATVGPTTANASGTWSFTSATALGDGVHTVKARATDAVGNTGPDSNTNSFTVDTTAPAAPVVVAPANGSTTSNNKPAYSGTAEAGSTVTVIVDGAAVGTTTANASGAWNFTPIASLADGVHTVKATAADAAGNTSPDSNTNSFTVDTTAPAAPTVATPANGSTTNDNTPTYSGTAEAGSTVTVIVDGAVVGPTTASASGTWSFTPTAGLLNGPHTVKATATDAAGNTSPGSNTNSFTVDTIVPAAPVVITPPNGSVTSNNRPTYSGTAEAGSTVTVYVDGTAVGPTTADASGNWSLTPATALADGVHTVKATATDEVGNTSPDSSANSFTVDTTAPAAPVVTAPANGSVSSNNKPAYSGTAEAGSTVTVIVDGTAVGITTANASGAWSLAQTTALADGVHTVKATATDTVGNTGPASNTNSFTVDTTAPAAPVVVAPADGSTLNRNRPTYSGTAEAGSTVTVIVDGAAVGTVKADAAGAWSLVSPAALSNGLHTVKATATDAVGNTSPESNTNTFTVDATIPPPPVVVTPENNSVTHDTTPTISGTSELNSTVTISLGTQELGTVQTDASGHWSFTPTTPLAEGSYDVSAVATNPVGNTGERSNVNHFTIDTTPPGAPVVTRPVNDSVTQDTTPTLSGTAEPNSTVTVSLNGSAVGTTTADTTGNWSLTPTTPLADGTYTVTATATDVAGNTSLASSPVRFFVDTTPPETTIVSAPSGQTENPDASFDFSSNESNVTYECSLDGAAFAACSDPVTFSGVAEGDHTLQVRARDAVGNVDPTPASATWTYQPPPPDWALLGTGVGCASAGGDPSSLAMMGLAVLSALVARKRRE
ncbi:MAG: adventurous gliding motility protein AgmC [Hyalangium sp.]|uniref:adventurous gliding motility protein AgmC n=1 Tax=Hyalangium sp. TaxID=2028555 RepID=UPI00389AD708